MKGTITQCRYCLLEAECLSKRVPIEYLCKSILEMAAYVEKHKSQLPFGSGQFLARYLNGSECLWRHRLLHIDGPLLFRVCVVDEDISRLGFPRTVQQADLQPSRHNSGTATVSLLSPTAGLSVVCPDQEVKSWQGCKRSARARRTGDNSLQEGHKGSC